MATSPLRGVPTESERHFLDEARRQLAARHEQLRHSLHQINDQINDRPGRAARAILHLCGDLDHKILSVVGGLSAHRDRPADHAAPGTASRDELLARLDTSFDRADAVLAVITPDRLREARTYDGSGRTVEGTVLTVVLGALLDLAAQTQEIALLTRSRPGSRCRTGWPALRTG
jgi:YD repeat-containing protein